MSIAGPLGRAIFGGEAVFRGLDLHFARERYALNGRYGRALPPGWSYAGTGSGRTVILPDGTILPIADGLPRIAPGRGFVNEDARTNRCANTNVNPANTTGVALVDTGTGATLSVVNDAAELATIGLSGNAFRLTAGTGTAFANFPGSGTANTNPHVMQAYARGGSGALLYSSGGTLATFGASSTYRRVIKPAEAPNIATRTMMIQADAGQTVFFVLNDFQESSFATSPIITTGASGTRGVDTAGINPLFGAISGEYTVVCDLDISRPAGIQQNAFLLWDGTNANRVYVFRQPGGAFELAVVSSNVYRGGRVSSVIATPGIVRVGLSCTAAGLFRMAINGLSLLDVGPVTAPVIDRIALGQVATTGDRTNDAIARLRALPFSVSGAELAALTV